MDTMRLFVGIGLPAAHQALVGGLRPRLEALVHGRASWVRQGNAHLTLKFLGDVPRERLDTVREALSRVRFAPFTLELGGGGFFPGPSRPRVVWVGMTAGGQACGALATAVDAALAGIGFAPEARPFAAHLTLGRVREPGRGGDWTGVLGLLEGVVWPAVTVEEFVLFQSLATAGGVRYAVAARFGATGP